MFLFNLNFIMLQVSFVTYKIALQLLRTSLRNGKGSEQ